MKKVWAGFVCLLILMLDASALAEGGVPVRDRETLRGILKEAIEQCAQPPEMDAAGFPVEWGLELDAKNVYFDLLSARPELGYAYDLTAEAEQGMLRCRIDYMPYRTGNFPEGFEGEAVGSLWDLIRVANANLAQERVNIRITNPDLQVADMNAALSGQAGDTLIVCQLSRDGTQIVMQPSLEYTREEAIAYLRETETWADRVVAQVVREDMSMREAALACYAYLTENVVYDWDYYQRPMEMTPLSRTALGALRDHKAICGGYAQALQMLFARIGMPCVNVSGTAAGEAHLWNAAKLGDTWTLFDATFDRGLRSEFYRYFDAEIAQIADHAPQSNIADKLMAAYDMVGI